MDALFLTVLNMSLKASYVILFVIVIRLRYQLRLAATVFLQI